MYFPFTSKTFRNFQCFNSLVSQWHLLRMSCVQRTEIDCGEGEVEVPKKQKF